MCLYCDPAFVDVDTKGGNSKEFESQVHFLESLASRAVGEMNKLRNFNLAIVDTWEFSQFGLQEKLHRTWRTNVEKFEDLKFERGNCFYPYKLGAGKSRPLHEEAKREEFVDAFQKITALMSGGGTGAEEDGGDSDSDTQSDDGTSSP